MATAQFAFMPVDGSFLYAYANGVTVEAETISGSNAATTAAAAASQNVCRVTVDTACYVSFGTAPNAGTDSVRFLMNANTTEYFRIAAGSKAAVIAA